MTDEQRDDMLAMCVDTMGKIATAVEKLAKEVTGILRREREMQEEGAEVAERVIAEIRKHRAS